MRPITYMRVMRGEGLAGGSAETSLATARPFSSPHGSERHWSATQRLPRSKVSRWFDETVRSHRADNRLGLRRPGRAILASRCLVASAASWRRILANADEQSSPAQPASHKPNESLRRPARKQAKAPKNRVLRHPQQNGESGGAGDIRG